MVLVQIYIFKLNKINKNQILKSAKNINKVWMYKKCYYKKLINKNKVFL